MFRFFEYCRFQTAPRVLQGDPTAVKSAFEKRAAAHGGKLFGCWRSLVGLGLARDEGIAMTAWPDAATARNALPLTELATVTQAEVLESTVRPSNDDAPKYEGVYVFRWFDVPADDWQAFCDLSDAAWPNMEDVFDVNICGFWRHVDVAPPESKTLLLTRYKDMSVWEASRWWNAPKAEASPSMDRFRNRNEFITSTIAYPSLPIF